ncbi:EMILIN-3 [Engraulis encrasicolus]|uniref:EMILIN-3 n=1 Tax=Engraulis encrasicolus TaxID=184585 RepID=UPI002FD54AC0
MRLTAFNTHLLVLTAVLALSSALGRTHYLFQSQQGPQHPAGKVMGHHKSHCAYVVEKSVSFTMQDGVAPYVKAEYNKCSWGQKCPALMYRLFYKPLFKVAYKTVTELEWRCCPGFFGFGCKSGPMHKGPMPMHKGPMPMHKGPMPPFKGPMPSFKGPMPMNKGPMIVHKGPMPMHKGPMPMHKGPMPPFKGPVPPFKGPMPPFKGVNPQPTNRGQQWGQSPMNTRSQDNFDQDVGSYPNPPHSSISGHQDPLAAPTEDDIPNHHSLSPEHHDATLDHDHDPSLDHHDPSLDHHDPSLDHHDPSLDHHDPSLDHIDPTLDHHDPMLESHNPSADPVNAIADHNAAPGTHPITVNVEAEILAEEHPPPVDSHPNYDQDLDGLTAERLDRMEDDVQRLSRGLETLRGTVTGLEDSLRKSLREDANRMLSALLSAGPAAGPQPALLSRDSSVGFGDLPGVAPDREGLDGMQYPGLTELVGKMTELRSELQAKATELDEIRATVLGHDSALKKLANETHSLTGNPLAPEAKKALEKLVDGQISGARTAILGGFDRRVETAENRCEEKAGEVRRQCQKDQLDQESQLEEALDDSIDDLRKELADLHAQLQKLSSPEDGCCHAMSGLTERVVMLEQSMDGLNQSQGYLKAELGGHKDHVEGMLEGRLGYVESKLDITVTSPHGGSRGVPSTSLESRLEEKLKALEERLLTAVEELGNATVPALLEGKVVPTLETEVESLRKRVAVDVDRVQRHLTSLELMCSSSCAPALEGTTNVQANNNEHTTSADNHSKVLDQQAERMNRLNATMTLLLQKMAEMEMSAAGGLEGEVTLLKVNVRSVNRTLLGLRNSLGTVVQEVTRANSTWQDREERLAQQVKGVVQLVGKQASMLSSGERRLSRLKGELQEMRRRLAGELQGCRSAALGVQKEVTEVGGRVARVEGQCGGLSHLAEDLERIRSELEGHSDGQLVQFNNTLASHSSQLSELRDELRNCTGAATAVGKALGDFHIAPNHVTPEVAAEPRGDQFAAPVQPKTPH